MQHIVSANVQVHAVPDRAKSPDRENTQREIPNNGGNRVHDARKIDVKARAIRALVVNRSSRLWIARERHTGATRTQAVEPLLGGWGLCLRSTCRNTCPRRLPRSRHRIPLLIINARAIEARKSLLRRHAPLLVIVCHVFCLYLINNGSVSGHSG